MTGRYLGHGWVITSLRVIIVSCPRYLCISNTSGHILWPVYQQSPQQYKLVTSWVASMNWRVSSITFLPHIRTIFASLSTIILQIIQTDNCMANLKWIWKCHSRIKTWWLMITWQLCMSTFEMNMKMPFRNYNLTANDNLTAMYVTSTSHSTWWTIVTGSSSVLKILNSPSKLPLSYLNSRSGWLIIVWTFHTGVQLCCGMLGSIPVAGTDAYRDLFVHAPSQWETTLHCNVVSHWLGAYTKWSLLCKDPPASLLQTAPGWSSNWRTCENISWASWMEENSSVLWSLHTKSHLLLFDGRSTDNSIPEVLLESICDSYVKNGRTQRPYRLKTFINDHSALMKRRA